MKDTHVSIIQQEQINLLNIDPTMCVQWIKQAFLLKNEAQMPAKLSVHPRDTDFITSMPCLLPKQEKQYFGLKLVSRIIGQQPMLKSEIYLYDAEDGTLLAIIDGDWITAMRTGAVAATAVQTFQRQGIDTYSFMGLGNIARATALCLIAINKHRRITLRLLRYKNQAELFIERFKDFNNVAFDIIDDKDAFVSKADVIVSCITLANDLLFPNNKLFKQGVTIVPVHMRGFQNCDTWFDKVFGDDTSQIQNFRYFKQFRQYNEIHRVLSGDIPGRENAKERILSYNYGIALHDIYFASKIYEMAQSTATSFQLYKQNHKIWI